MRTMESFNNGWRACLPTIVVNGKTIPRDGSHPFYPFGEEF